MDCLERKIFPPEDYHKLVELILFFFGGHIKRGFCICYAGSDHHARWMSKAIYYTKIFLLSRTFELTDEEARKVERMAEYICLFYAKYFLQSAITSAAPANDLHFFYLMRKFKSINLKSAEGTIKSFERHLGYLSEELVVFSLFDDSVSYAEKTMMGQKLINLPRP